MGKRLMFGYATLSQPEYMEALLGAVPAHSQASLPEHELCLQKYEDLPQQVKNVVDQNWPRGQFESYFVRKASRPESTVDGVVWEIDPEQEKILDDWEFEGLWYKKEQVKIRVNGEERDAFVYVINEGLGETVQGDYDCFPVDKEKLLKLARENNLTARRN